LPAHRGGAAHPAPAAVADALAALAAGAARLGGGLLNLPPLVGGGAWLNHRLGSLAGREIVAPHATEWALAGLATGLVILGWGLARWRYGRFRGNVKTASVISCCAAGVPMPWSMP